MESHDFVLGLEDIGVQSEVLDLGYTLGSMAIIVALLFSLFTTIFVKWSFFSYIVFHVPEWKPVNTHILLEMV